MTLNIFQIFFNLIHHNCVYVQLPVNNISISFPWLRKYQEDKSTPGQCKFINLSITAHPKAFYSSYTYNLYLFFPHLKWIRQKAQTVMFTSKWKAQNPLSWRLSQDRKVTDRYKSLTFLHKILLTETFTV